MIVLAVKPGHDGAVAAIKDDRLLFSVEAEKDSVRRHREIDVSTLHAHWDGVKCVYRVRAERAPTSLRRDRP